MGWVARLTPFESQRGARGVGVPFIERVELEIWWMNGTRRQSFRLEGFHRSVMTRADVALVGSGVGLPGIGPQAIGAPGLAPPGTPVQVPDLDNDSDEP